MDETRFEHRNLDVACQLDAAEAGGRLEEWTRLRETAVVRTELIPGGVRLWLRPEDRERVEDLARREAACCGFLDLSLSTEEDQLRLDVTSPVAEAGSTIAALTGTASEGVRSCC